MLFYIATATIFTVLLLKLPLFLSRQVVPHTTLPLICPETANGSQLGRGEEYIFTMVMYSLLYIGRFLESLILQIQIYKETHPLEFVALCIKGLTQKKWITACFVVLSVYMLAHSLSIPAMGIALEIRTGRVTDCESYVYEYHTVYMVYNFNQLFLLTLPYLCTKKINTDHGDYVFESRRLAFTHINKIQEEDHFYFTPRIWGTSIKIQVDNPLYIMFLLVGIFFTIAEALI